MTVTGGTERADPLDLAVELLGDIRHLDEQLKTSHKRIRAAVVASGTRLTELFGIGPIIAAMLIGYTGDIGRVGRRVRDARTAFCSGKRSLGGCRAKRLRPKVAGNGSVV